MAMNSGRITKVAEDFGRSNFKAKPPPATRSQKWLLVAFISLFVLVAFAADLWPCKKIYFWFDCCGVRAFNELDNIRPALRYSFGGSGEEQDSLTYLVLLKLVHAVIPPHLLCLRVLSVLATCVSLFFLYRLSTILFSRSIALIFILLLVTSPIYLESMRAFGYHALSHMVVAIGCYLLAASLNGRKIFLKISILVLLCFLSLSLYVVARLVVLLPVVYFGLYLRKDWRRLLLFLLLLASLILIPDYALDDTGLSVKDFFLNPDLDPGEAWIASSGKINPALVKKHLARNLKFGFMYLANVKRTAFHHENVYSRLFSVEYTPFMVIGLAICLWRRKRSNILVILLFFLFFVLPMASGNIRPRRVLFSLYPINLTIALGLWYVFSFLSRLIPSRAFRFKIACLSAVFLALVSGYSFYDFFSKVSKPQHDYTSSQLKAIADLLLREGPEIDVISYTWPVSYLIWGNPYFVNRKGSLALFEKRAPDYGLRASLEFARAVKENFLYLFALSGKHKHFGRYERLFSDFAWVEKKQSDQFSVSSIPGTDLYYILVSNEGKAPPPATGDPLDQIDLLSPKNVRVTAYSPEESRESPRRLIEREVDSVRHVYLRHSESPTWVLVDFGKDNRKRVEILAVRAALLEEELYFKDAKLYGSHDGRNWRQVAPRVSPVYNQEIATRSGWRNWFFDTVEKFRYYKLFLAGSQGGAGRQARAPARLIMVEVRK